MPSTTLYKRWDIVLLSFPFTNFISDKRRPAIVLSPDSFNVGNDLIIGFITSQLRSTPKTGDYVLRRWAEAGLPKPSMFRMKFATVDRSIVVKRIGRAETTDQVEIRKRLISFFGS